jgi:hypothetical protein
MAEWILERVQGQENLRGTTRFWEMIIELWPLLQAHKLNHLFSGSMNSLILLESGAAIFQICPESPIFKLPAFAGPDIRNWMRICYPQELSHLQVQIGELIALEKVQNKVMNMNFHTMYLFSPSQRNLGLSSSSGKLPYLLFACLEL